MLTVIPSVQKKCRVAGPDDSSDPALKTCANQLVQIIADTVSLLLHALA